MSAPSSVQPAIVLICHPAAPAWLIDAFLLGCEEEGVLVKTQTFIGPATIIARMAAEQSTVFVGVGIDGTGAMALHEQRLGDGPPLIFVSDAMADQGRSIGMTAGRLVRGRPIEDVVVNNNLTFRLL